MKTSILTFHESNNSGALLQAYALQTVLSRLSQESCDILNYHSKYKALNYSVRFNKNLLVFFNKLLSLPLQKNIQKNAVQFRKEYLNITNKVYKSPKEMIELNNKYDKFFCGSDQVWNPVNTGADDTYFLSFVTDKQKIVSYAPSIALSQIPNEYVDFLTENINRFHYLSVREKSGREIIKNLTGRNAKWVLDPTLLLKKNEWNIISKKPNINKPYIFVYYISYIPELIDFVSKLKKKTGFDVIVSVKTVRDIFVCSMKGFTAKIISTQEFVGCIANAEYIVTNSFHGTAFSVNYEKEFFTFGNKKGLSKANSRITDFLDKFGLIERFISNNSTVATCVENSKIEYSDVSEYLATEREDSLSYITNALLNNEG